MVKEIIICICIVGIILIGNYVTQNYTKEMEKEMNEKLSYLKEELKKMEEEKEVDIENIEKEVDNINTIWKRRYKRLAYYIEHDELEKVEIYLVSFTSFVEMKQYVEAINEIDKCIFLLKHIEDKYSMSLENIF